MTDENKQEALKPGETPVEKPELSLAEQKQALMKQFDVINHEQKRKVAREMQKLKDKTEAKMFSWNYDNAADVFLYDMDAEAKKFKDKAEVLNKKETTSDTVTELTKLKESMEEDFGKDTGNIIAMLNKMAESEYKITKEGLARVELYIPMMKSLMKSPLMQPLVNIFTEAILVQKLDEKTEIYKVLEQSMLSPNAEMITTASTILRLMRPSAKEDFTKKFIDAHPEEAMKLLLDANRFGTYSAFEMKKYYEYAATTYEKKPGENYQEARKRFLGKIDSFDEDAGEYQMCNKIQEQIRERVQGLGTGVYGEDASSRLTLPAIGGFLGKVVSWTALVGNGLANRPMIMKKYKEEGLFPAISSYVKNPYVAGSILALGLLKKNKGDWTPKEKREQKERVKGAKRLVALTEMHSTWGMFLENGGVDTLTAYAKTLKNADGAKKEPTIKGFEEFLATNEKKTGIVDPSRKYLGDNVFKKFEKDETSNLKMYLTLMEEQKIQTQKEFNTKIDEARQGI